MIEEVKLDIFKAPIDVLLHGSNCQKRMGRGIAKIIKERFPEASAADNASMKGLGDYSWARARNPEYPQIRYVVNLYQQDLYNRYKRVLDYEAFYSSILKAENEFRKELVFGFPSKIGCNNAGGGWRVVREMLYDVFESSPRKVLICALDSAPGDDIQ